MNGQNTQTQSLKEVGINVSQVSSDTAGLDSGSQHYITMPSFFYLSLQAMQDGANIWLEQQKNTLEAEKEQQMIMIGGKQNKDGSWTVDFDKGFIKMLSDATIDVGKDQADALRSDAISHFTNAGMNAGSAVYTGAKGWQNDSAIKTKTSEIESAESFKATLDQPDNTAGLKLGETAPSDTDVTGRINDWKNGRQLKFDDENKIDRLAMNKLKADADSNPEDLKTVKNNTQKEIDRLKSERDVLGRAPEETRFKTQMFTGIATNSMDGGMAIQKENAKKEEAKDQAAATVFQTVQQTAMSQVDKMRDQSTQAQQEADQILRGIGQLRA